MQCHNPGFDLYTTELCRVIFFNPAYQRAKFRIATKIRIYLACDHDVDMAEFCSKVHFIAKAGRNPDDMMNQWHEIFL